MKIRIMKTTNNAAKMVGQSYGKWTVVGGATSRNYQPYVSAKCECGTVRDVCAYSLRSGASKNCGCVRKNVLGDAVRKHGMTIGGGTKVYRAYGAMHTRCFNENATVSESYKRKGIVVCQGWRRPHGLVPFSRQMGHPPSNSHTVDRINNNGNYSCGKCPECIAKGWPMNCKWSTRKEQARNTSQNIFVTVNGTKMCVLDAAALLRIPKKRLYDRAKASEQMLVL